MRATWGVGSEAIWTISTRRVLVISQPKGHLIKTGQLVGEGKRSPSPSDQASLLSSRVSWASKTTNDKQPFTASQPATPKKERIRTGETMTGPACRVREEKWWLSGGCASPPSARPKRSLSRDGSQALNPVHEDRTAADCAECIETRPDENGWWDGIASSECMTGGAAGACQKVGVTVPASLPQGDAGKAGSLHWNWKAGWGADPAWSWAELEREMEMELELELELARAGSSWTGRLLHWCTSCCAEWKLAGRNLKRSAQARAR